MDNPPRGAPPRPGGRVGPGANGMRQQTPQWHALSVGSVDSNAGVDTCRSGAHRVAAQEGASIGFGGRNGVFWGAQGQRSHDPPPQEVLTKGGGLNLGVGGFAASR